MGISITYFFGLRMGVGMGMVLIYNQLLISVRDIENIGNTSKWKVRSNIHEYFKQVFCQILGILLGWFLYLINFN